MKVVVVESPGKIKSINKYLGAGYKVLASFGHVRDLPAKDGSVLPDQDFEMIWEVDAQSQKRIKDIADAAKDNATSAMIDDWTDQAERRAWFLFEAGREG